MGLARNIIGGAVAGGVAIFGGVGALSDDTTRNETGQITASGGVGAYKVRVGDCIQMPSDAGEVVSVEGVPCTTPHGAQAFASFTLPDLPAFPSPDEMDMLAGRGCLGYWTDAIGTSYESDRALDMTFWYPTQASWDQNDREVTCFVMSNDGSPLIGTKLVT
jgi:hypothetical protein